MIRISRIYIKRYRSIMKLVLQVEASDSVITICGENNTGKTNALRAIDLFFNPRKYSPATDAPHHKYKGTRGGAVFPEITLDFIKNDSELFSVTQAFGIDGLKAGHPKGYKCPVDNKRSRQRLEGFRVPGSRFRRIPRLSLIKFMKDNSIPLDTIASGKRKVLIVDDDDEVVELMVDILARDGRFETMTASSGYEAGIATEQFRPEVILLDYMLPDINGNVVCRTIRSNPKFEDIRIIIVSGVVREDEIEQLLQSGAEDFIRKPFKVDELIDKISATLKLV